MRRTIQIVILLFILFLIYQFISSWLIKEHKIEYTITNGDKKFDIKETYKEGIYYFDVREGNRIFSFHNNSSFNNAIEIIDTIRSMAKKYFPSEITIEVNPRYNYRAKIIRLQKCRNKQIKYWTSRNQQFIIKADRKNSYL